MSSNHVYPSDRCGSYRLPRRIFEILEIRLRGFKNRLNAHRLAAFLARMNAVPDKFGRPFPVDRRALAINATLDLTEDQIRGALRTLEAVGFLDRQTSQHSPYQRTLPSLAQPRGGVKRRPIQFVFGVDFVGFFAWIAKRCLARLSAPKDSSDLSYQNYNPLKTGGEKSQVSLGWKVTSGLLDAVRRAQTRIAPRW